MSRCVQYGRNSNGLHTGVEVSHILTTPQNRFESCSRITDEETDSTERLSDLPKAAQLFLRKQGSSFCDYADRLEGEGEDVGRAQGGDREELQGSTQGGFHTEDGFEQEVGEAEW